MNLAFGVLFLWLGAACLWIATHGTAAATPWDAYREVIDAIREGAGA